MIASILQVVAIGAKTFSSEREAYFKKQVKEIQTTIFEVADSDFYHKDMEAKGKAEREIQRRTHDLMGQFIAEGNK